MGCIVGSAVGDALGAPFEFGPVGQYSAQFPQPVRGGVGEMIGGGGFAWAPGQFTDDTEMAVAVAESLIARGGIDADDQLARFRAWGANAKDIGNLTREVLDCGLPAAEAASTVTQGRQGHHTAGNGSLTRAAPGAVYFSNRDRAATVDAAFALSAVTHPDPLCQWAVAIVHEVVRLAIAGTSVIAAIDQAVAMLDDEAMAVYGPLLDTSWTPDTGGPSNGSAMGALAQAVWAIRRGESYADVVTAVIDLGGDTDSVAAVAGALAGLRFGIQGIPSRWLTYVHGNVTGPDGQLRRYDHLALQQLALSLLGDPVAPPPRDEPFIQPREVMPGLWATNRSGARSVPADRAVVSLCRIDESMRRPVRREAYLIDKNDDSNPSLSTVVDDVLDSIDAFLAEGRQVVVHCHGGRSRTGLIIAAYLMRRGHTLAEAEVLLANKWPDAHLENTAFAEELANRAKWSDLTDRVIEERLRAVPAETWQRLWATVDELARVDPGELLTWTVGTQRAELIDGVERTVHTVHTVPGPVYSEALGRLILNTYAAQLVQPFSYSEWLRRSPFGDAHRTNLPMDDVSVGDAVRLITVIVRGDRFSEGSLAARIEDGTFLSLLDAVRKWLHR
jgi:ADP-ribosyl-[dinitrogen reductase] hydrolase